jgi:hypothetical protein
VDSQPGHETGQRPLPPVGMTWRVLVDLHVEEFGSLAAVARKLCGNEAGRDAETTEKGLRRLRSQSSGGGKWGKLLLAELGVPIPVQEWVKALGQYHSRFADLPAQVRLDQLRRWDRPPMSESAVGPWILIGIASTSLRLKRVEQANTYVERARVCAAQAGIAAEIELALVADRLLPQETDPATRLEYLEEAKYLLGLATGAMTPVEHACYAARLADQHAWWLTRREAGGPDYDRAARLYASIPVEHPFAGFRHHHGLAYCHWRLGEVEVAAEHGRAAATQAGDGGYVRFRAMALDLLSRITGDAEPARRAQEMAQRLEDADLGARFKRRR